MGRWNKVHKAGGRGESSGSCHEWMGVTPKEPPGAATEVSRDYFQDLTPAWDVSRPHQSLMRQHKSPCLAKPSNFQATYSTPAFLVVHKENTSPSPPHMWQELSLNSCVSFLIAPQWTWDLSLKLANGQSDGEIQDQEGAEGLLCPVHQPLAKGSASNWYRNTWAQELETTLGNRANPVSKIIKSLLSCLELLWHERLDRG
jgi:hypothetical protein